VKRQYSGAAGRIENSQIGVFLCYGSDKGAALVDREPYIPQEWIADRERPSIEEKPECAYYLCHASSGKDTIETLVRVAGQRWLIEQSLEAAKGECGLDHYEVRYWQGWYRHITLSMLAHAVLSALRAREEKTPHAQVRLSVPELRHLLTALLWLGWQGIEHLLHWSEWRRRHQFHPIVLPLSKARIDSADLLSTTVVLIDD
jgi:SRSO17 transposase